jgi:hypothetical protein
MGMNEDEKRCYATTLYHGARAYCTRPAHPSTELHRDEAVEHWWLDASGFDALTQQNGDGDVDMDHPRSERLVERVPSDPIVDSARRRGVSEPESQNVDGGVQDAVERLVAALREESARELGALATSNQELRAENKRLQQLILDAGSVITAAVGSIGEPREWSVKAEPRYRETFLGPKRARQWQRLIRSWPDLDAGFKAENVAAVLNTTHEAASSLLRDAEREGKAERVSRGVYRVAR